MKHHRRVLGAAVMATAVTALSVAPPASAATVSDPLVQGLVGPLQLDVSNDGVFISENFAGRLSQLRPDGTLRTVASAPDLAGIAAEHGRFVFTTTQFGDDGTSTRAKLRIKARDGKVRTLVNLQRFERTTNPDSNRQYGVRGLPADCEVAPDFAPYQGHVDSHPYAIAEAPGGGWFVADAAGNDILHVSPRGEVDVVAVLKAQKLTITSEIATGFGFPDCAVGLKFAFEPVPTDVEVARNGKLFVSLLPGGPEGPELGARGALVKVNPKTGRSKVVARGFAGATNVALDRSGNAYVAELFGGAVTQVDRATGAKSPAATLPGPAAVEFYAGKVYVTYDALPAGPNDPPDGKLAIIDPSGVARN